MASTKSKDLRTFLSMNALEPRGDSAGARRTIRDVWSWKYALPIVAITGLVMSFNFVMTFVPVGWRESMTNWFYFGIPLGILAYLYDFVLCIGVSFGIFAAFSAWQARIDKSGTGQAVGKEAWSRALCVLRNFITLEFYFNVLIACIILVSAAGAHHEIGAYAMPTFRIAFIFGIFANSVHELDKARPGHLAAHVLSIAFVLFLVYGFVYYGIRAAEFLFAAALGG
nr:hypothetical protein [Candidatus Sigynarchaeota archaeon]